MVALRENLAVGSDGMPARRSHGGGQVNCGQRLKLLPESVVSGGRALPGAPHYLKELELGSSLSVGVVFARVWHLAGL